MYCSYINYDRAYQSIDESLGRLGFDYIDLMLVHQSGSGDEEVYKALCQGVADGKIRQSEYRIIIRQMKWNA